MWSCNVEVDQNSRGASCKEDLAIAVGQHGEGK